MMICAAGDIHGALDRLYEDVLAFEVSLGVRFEWVLHVGDVGGWPTPQRIDERSRTITATSPFRHGTRYRSSDPPKLSRC